MLIAHERFPCTTHYTCGSIEQHDSRHAHISRQLGHREVPPCKLTCCTPTHTSHGKRTNLQIKLQNGSDSHCSVGQCRPMGHAQHNLLPALWQHKHTRFTARRWPQNVQILRIRLSWIQFNLCHWCMHCNMCMCSIPNLALFAIDCD